MLPPAVGAFENPRSSRELISQPPGAPDAREPVGPTQLRQGGDARRLIPIAIHECEKSGHHRPLLPPQDRRRIRTQQEHIKNITTHPALTGEGGKGELDQALAEQKARQEKEQLQFAKIQEVRAEIISRLYSKLVHAYTTAYFPNILLHADKPVPSEAIDAILKACWDAIATFDENRLFFPS